MKSILFILAVVACAAALSYRGLVPASKPAKPAVAKRAPAEIADLSAKSHEESYHLTVDLRPSFAPDNHQEPLPVSTVPSKNQEK